MSTIKSLQVSNVKRLKAVEIDAAGKPIVVVGGDNGHGKSSCLDSIMYALGGGASIPGEPVRRGASKAEVRLCIDDNGTALVVRRKFKGERTTLEVTEDAGDGPRKLSSPQKVLDALCSKVAFDPLMFTRLRPAEQVATLKAVVGVDTTKIDEQIKAVYDERTAVNRDVAAMTNMYGECPEELADVPLEPVDTEALYRRLNDAHAANSEAKATTGKLEALRNRIQDIDKLIEHNLAEIARLKGLVESLKDEREKRRQEGRAIKHADKPLVDVVAIQHEINEAQRTNTLIDRRATFDEGKRRLDDTIAKRDQLTDRLEGLREQRVQMVASAKWPVEGVGFTDTGVTFNGLPFDQASSAEQLRIAVAIGIAANPKLRVMLLRDGSLLDENSMRLLHELAKGHDAQLWVERVSKGAECTVVIEDGEVSNGHR